MINRRVMRDSPAALGPADGMRGGAVALLICGSVLAWMIRRWG